MQENKVLYPICFVAFLISVVSTIITAVSPSFMKQNLLMTCAQIGFYECLLESFSFMAKFGSGFVSDVIRNRKLLILIGIVVTAISMPLVGFSIGPLLFFYGRLLNRIGNGLVCTPRDALIGDICTIGSGRCFGLKEIFVMAGSIFASFLVFYLLYLTQNNYRLIFIIATLPCILSLHITIKFLKEPAEICKIRLTFQEKFKKIYGDLMVLNKRFWYLIILIFVFHLGRYGESVLIVNALEKLNAPATYAPLVMFCAMGANFSVIYPMGALAEMIGKERILILGFLIAIAAHYLTAFSTSYLGVFGGVIFWGIQYGVTFLIFTSMLSDYVDVSLRGTAFSLYYLVGFIATFVGGYIFKFVCQSYGISYAFLLDAIIAAITVILSYIMFFKLTFNSEI